MAVLDDMADITAEHAVDTLRYFAGVDPETDEVTVHHPRDDVEWTDHQEREVREELHEWQRRRATSTPWASATSTR